MRFILHTFGCKSNQYESQAIRESLVAAGHGETDDPAAADLLILNSCGVTGRAAASCRNALRRMLRANPRLLTVVTGCGVDLGEEWPDIPGGPPLLVPNAKKHALPELVARMEAAADALPSVRDERFAQTISYFQGHTRAFLKIQDGCDNHCSYCAVPLARGAPQSRPPEDILPEAARLVANGHGEIVLTGINIGAYRHGNVDFPDIVRRIADTPGLVRLRLGSVEPPQMTEELVAAMRDHGKICPHVHLPLQSGDDRILAAMGRRYAAAAFLDKTAMLRSGLKLPAITTDVIVGFPGEDDDAFANSLDLCRRAGFSRLHVFLFSPRPGTPAAGMRRRVPDATVEGWKTRLLEYGREAAAAFAAACVGLRERVIVEADNGGAPGGLGDRYVRVSLPGEGVRPGDVVEAEITTADGAELAGRVV